MRHLEMRSRTALVRRTPISAFQRTKEWDKWISHGRERQIWMRSLQKVQIACSSCVQLRGALALPAWPSKNIFWNRLVKTFSKCFFWILREIPHLEIKSYDFLTAKSRFSEFFGAPKSRGLDYRSLNTIHVGGSNIVRNNQILRLW